MYDQHRDLLDGQARRNVEAFLHSDAELPAFGKVCISLVPWHVFEGTLIQPGSNHCVPSHLQRIQTLRDCSACLGELRRSARLNLLQLSCGQINDLLSCTALELANVITTHLIDDNREKNKE